MKKDKNKPKSKDKKILKITIIAFAALFGLMSAAVTFVSYTQLHVNPITGIWAYTTMYLTDKKCVKAKDFPLVFLFKDGFSFEEIENLGYNVLEETQMGSSISLEKDGKRYNGSIDAGGYFHCWNQD